MSTQALIGILVFALALGGVALVLLRRQRLRVEAQQLLSQKDRRFPVKLGDVRRVGEEEFKFRAGWLLVEGDAPFVEIWQSGERTVIAFPSPDAGVYLADPCQLEQVMPRQPPAVFEFEEVVYARFTTAGVRVLLLGEAPPAPWSYAVFVEYRDKERNSLFAVSDGKVTRAWKPDGTKIRLRSDGSVRRSEMPPAKDSPAPAEKPPAGA